MSEFPFRKNTDTRALQDTKPSKGKVGRPKKQEESRTEPVGCYLTPTEKELLLNKLDGRSASTTLRKLILEYIKE